MENKQKATENNGNNNNTLYSYLRDFRLHTVQTHMQRKLGNRSRGADPILNGTNVAKEEESSSPNTLQICFLTSFRLFNT